MASASVILSSADSPDCDPCKDKGSDTEATWHCDECRESMCHECHDVHARLSMTKGHMTRRLGPTLGSAWDGDTRANTKIAPEKKHVSDSSGKGLAAPGQKQVQHKLVIDIKHVRLGDTSETSRSTQTSASTSSHKLPSSSHKLPSSSQNSPPTAAKPPPAAAKSPPIATKPAHIVTKPPYLIAKRRIIGTNPAINSPNPPTIGGTSPTISGNNPISPTITANPPTNTPNPLASSRATTMNHFDASNYIDDKPCEIRGILVMKDLILIADIANNKVKAFDRDKLTFVFHTKVDSPYDLAEISYDTMAVSSVEDRYFTVFSLQDSGMAEVRRVSTHIACFGLCHHKGLIYVSCVANRGVALISVYTPDGTLKRRLEPLYQGQKVLHRPDYMVINHATETLYLGNWESSSVVGLTLSGEVLFNHKPQKCVNIGGVAIDDQGQLYLSGTNSNNVIRMSADRLTSHTLVWEDISWPGCLFVDGNQLFLCCKHSNVVSIYRLS